MYTYAETLEKLFMVSGQFQKIFWLRQNTPASNQKTCFFSQNNLFVWPKSVKTLSKWSCAFKKYSKAKHVKSIICQNWTNRFSGWWQSGDNVQRKQQGCLEISPLPTGIMVLSQEASRNSFAMDFYGSPIALIYHHATFIFIELC